VVTAGVLRRVFAPGAVRADLPLLFVASASAAVFVLFAAKDGGFAATVWLPAGVFFVVMLTLVLAFVSASIGRVELLAVAALAAFTAWCGLSIAWAGARGDAWDGANRTLLYLCVFSLFVVLPWRAAAAAYFVSVLAVGVTAVSVVQFLRVAAAPVAHHDFFIAGRFSAPISYPNADCALLLMAAFPAVLLASRREIPILARGLLLATAGSSFELAISSQSRMSLVAMPLTLLLVLVVTAQRVRLLTTILPVAVVSAIAAPRMLDIYDAVFDAPGGHALRAARTALLISAAVLFAAGCLLAALDRRLEPSVRVVRGGGMVALAASALAVIAGAFALVRAVPHPVGSLERGWTSFSQGTGYSNDRTSHLISSGTSRYDIWRVALDEIARAPLAGVGVDNFAADYLRHRRSSNSPLYPHSLVLRVLSETGLVGAALFACFLGAIAVAARRLGRPGTSGAAALAAASVFVYWFIHGAVDWLWEIPALGAPAFACAAITVRIAARERPGSQPRQIPTAVLATAAVALAASFAFPWIAAQETAVAASSWPSDPASARSRLDLAAKLNPLSDLPAETRGLIEARLDQPAAARKAFEQALDRNPANWFSELELGVMEVQLQRHAAALSAIRRSAALNPREETIRMVERRVLRRAPVTQSLVDDALAAEQDASGLGR
jgi:O-antigen ligase/polysaccharide polymerase Wzy-like membrane protein